MPEYGSRIDYMVVTMYKSKRNTQDYVWNCIVFYV